YKLGFGGILADEMGLGKTLQTISFLASNKEKKFLIIVPTSLIFNWRDEFLKFTPELNIGIVYGDKRDCIIENYESYNGLITTYGVLKNDLEKFLDKEIVCNVFPKPISSAKIPPKPNLYKSLIHLIPSS
ncbi:DEAD/DEAH box helicase family protein, partial [Clostridium saudiense]|nr:DEAD/DEAH box helicase family protein [Clostridium saudiense]